MRYRSEPLLLVLAAILFAAGPSPDDASAAEWRPVTSLLELRQRNVVMQQWDISCGAAALATLLRYQHNDPVSETDVAASMLQGTSAEKVRATFGFSLLDLKRYADGRGYEGMGYGNVTFEDLTEMTPAIVPIKTRQFPHFVVFRGFPNGRVLLADPSYGNRTMTREHFEKVWRGNVAFVVKRPNGGGRDELSAPDASGSLFPKPQTVRSAID